MMRRSSSGYSLVEMAIALTVVAVILGAIWFFWQRFIDDARFSRFQVQLDQIILGTRDLFAVRANGVENIPGGGPSIMQQLISANAIPGEMVENGTNIARTPWDSVVEVQRPQAGDIIASNLASRPAQPPLEFIISMLQMPPKMCARLLGGYFNSEIQMENFGLLGVRFNTSGTFIGPLAPEEIAPNCTRNNRRPITIQIIARLRA